MKSILKLLVQLYPSAWRSRYGAEFDALLEEKKPRTRDIFDVLSNAIKMRITSRSFVRIVLPCLLAGTLVGLAASFAIPLRYSSQTTFTVLTTDRSADDLVAKGAKGIFSREFLASVIEKQNLYPPERSRIPLDNVINKMAGDIHFIVTPVTSDTATDMFEGLSFLPIKSGRLEPINIVVQFDYPLPRVAQQVDRKLIEQLFSHHRPSSLASWTAQKMNNFLRTAPSLPQKPIGPSRPQLTTIGLFSGLLCGLILAVVARSRNRIAPTTASPIAHPSSTPHKKSSAA